jgi:hypothetical protein
MFAVFCPYVCRIHLLQSFVNILEVNFMDLSLDGMFGFLSFCLSNLHDEKKSNSELQDESYSSEITTISSKFSPLFLNCLAECK